AFGALAPNDPGIGERPVQALGGEHVHQGPLGDLQVFDEVEAVELGTARHDLRQVPALGRCRPANTPHAILQSESREHAVDSGLARRMRHLRLQRRRDRVRPILTQDAFAQLHAKFGDALFEGKARAIPGPSRLAICKIGAIEPFTLRALYPKGSSALAKAELQCRLTDAHACTHRLDHRPTAALTRCFLAMFSLFGKASHYKKTVQGTLIHDRPTNAETYPVTRGPLVVLGAFRPVSVHARLVRQRAVPVLPPSPVAVAGHGSPVGDIRRLVRAARLAVLAVGQQVELPVLA